MIKNKKDYLYYIKCDREARGFNKKKLFGIRGEIPVYKFQLLMRKVEYYNNCKTDFFSKLYLLILKYRYKKQQIKYGFSIPINTFGPGLYIRHRGTICVNGSARIGSNCRINVDVNIGTNMEKEEEAPVIGDNCFIGPGAKLFGKIIIGNNVAIGANAVVNKSFGDNVTIAGVPAKIVNTTGTKNRMRYYIKGKDYEK